MCGIFGALVAQGAELNAAQFHALIDRLFVLSESRGREAAGLAMRNGGQLAIYKSPVEASTMIKEPQYKKLLHSVSTTDDGLALIGHSRLVTDGHRANQNNNQPVRHDRIIAVHNGIIVNAEKLWTANTELNRQYEIDTEIMVALIDQSIQGGHTFQIAVNSVIQQLEGTVSTALLSSDLSEAVIVTNNGSLYIVEEASGQLILFASEKYILTEATISAQVLGDFSSSNIKQIKPNQALHIELTNLTVSEFQIGKLNYEKAASQAINFKSLPITDFTDARQPSNANLRRCTKCILPETMPFIEFDQNGICNYCRERSPKPIQGREALESALNPFRRSDGSPDCLVAISGGRDSCYGLHIIKSELGMNPISYTYDWGMVTDLARRNQARLCGKLGIEHIIVSADIRHKRNNIRKNIEAWLKQPDLGMVPIFTAGDKQYFYYAQQIMKKNDINLLFYLENERYEKTHFKAGFCNIDEGHKRIYNISLAQKLQLGFYYARRFASNPRYLNRSLFDTFSAYLASYFLQHDFISLFKYVVWDEDTVVSTLREEYDWELAPDTKSTWRIGDGTAAFYNYIYYTLAGFTEHDTFRSHQIRDGVMERDKALKLVQEDNRPRWESMQWYANTIGFDLAEAVRRIETAPRLYLST